MQVHYCYCEFNNGTIQYSYLESICKQSRTVWVLMHRCFNPNNSFHTDFTSISFIIMVLRWCLLRYSQFVFTGISRLNLCIQVKKTRYRALPARMSHRMGVSKTYLHYLSRKIKQHFYVSDETKASHVCANLYRYNNRLYKLKYI